MNVDPWQKKAEQEASSVIPPISAVSHVLASARSAPDWCSGLRAEEGDNTNMLTIHHAVHRRNPGLFIVAKKITDTFQIKALIILTQR